MSEWQPIETAPEFDELILYFPEIMRSNGQISHPVMIRVDRHPVSYPRKPTHWMPLPEPPTT